MCPMAKSVLIVDDVEIRRAVCELFTAEADFDVCGEAEEARAAGVSALVSKSEHMSVLLEKARALLYPMAA